LTVRKIIIESFLIEYEVDKALIDEFKTVDIPLTAKHHKDAIGGDGDTSFTVKGESVYNILKLLNKITADILIMQKTS